MRMEARMEHVYSKHIKNKNLHGYMVHGVPIKSLYDAETFCQMLGVQPDEDNLIYDPDAAGKAATQGDNEMCYLNFMFIEKELEKANKDVEATQAEIARFEEEQKKSPSIWWSSQITTAKRRLTEQVGILRGLRRAQSAISDRKNELWNLYRERYHALPSEES